jgi:hypothetical protein
MMATHTFNRYGRFVSESKNLRGVVDNARKHYGVRKIIVRAIKDSRFAVFVEFNYWDGYYSVTNFADVTVCLDWIEKRYPCRTHYIK